MDFLWLLMHCIDGLGVFISKPMIFYLELLTLLVDPQVVLGKPFLASTHGCVRM